MSVGTLSDSEIRTRCEKGELISENFLPANIKQCCYELRASKVYYDLSLVSSSRSIEVPSDSYILIKPGQTVVIITEEALNIPSDMLGRILSKGKLFSVGLSPVNTYADPGFRGNLGLVFHNLSKNYLKLKPLENIAKIEFSHISAPVQNPYHGQHGYGTKIWPIPVDMILTSEEIKKDSRIGNAIDELELSQGRPVADIVRRLSVIENRLIISSCIYFFLMIILVSVIGAGEKVSVMWSVGTGLISNIIFMLLVSFVTKIRS